MFFVTRAHFDDFTVCKKQSLAGYILASSVWGKRFIWGLSFCWLYLLLKTFHQPCLKSLCLPDRRAILWQLWRYSRRLLWFVPLHAWGTSVCWSKMSCWSCDHRLDLEQVFVYIMYIIVHTGRPPPTQCLFCVFLYIHLKYTHGCVGTIWYSFTFLNTTLAQITIIHHCCVNECV